MHYPANTQPTHARWERVPLSPSEANSSSAIFLPLPSTITKNFMVTDTTYVSPSYPDMPPPGPDSGLDDFDTSLSSVPQDIINLLDEQQKRDFLAAREEERRWRGKWGTEEKDGLRKGLEISYNN